MRRKRTGGAGRGGGSREHARLTADKHTRVSTGAGARAAGAAGKQQQTSWRHFSTTLEENFWRESWMMLWAMMLMMLCLYCGTCSSTYCAT